MSTTATATQPQQTQDKPSGEPVAMIEGKADGVSLYHVEAI